MSVIATDTQRLSNLVKFFESKIEVHLDKLTVNEAAIKTYDVGTVLGKVTATGKYKISVKTAVDGSEVPAAIVVWDKLGDAHSFSIAATTDTPVMALVRGKAIVADKALKLDASWNTFESTVYAALKTQDIFVESQV